ncbi:MAG: hypothetical protein IMW88_09340 [Thermoflavifilum sp.]|jgi:hypothetical protein|uniref:hypothetical protein n=1 Tax=Thermoflavifilum sp. TaxID=1968839 RepID=UPI0018A4D918|nr:hypothetical protein [Thermoflavifilum sp.]QOR75538.1 MAG: hypothetical protein IMW88_09340 [Thermoflavifilum sp.]
MPNQVNDALFQLVKTLTKAEKRYFQLYLKSRKTKDDLLFVKLFEVMDKMSRYDEKQILQKIPAIRKSQLSNLKAHVYKHVLTSLRLLYKQKDPLLELREQFDFARVLFDKGLYQQSLKMLNKVKEQARKRHELLLWQEVLEFEKIIESRHIMQDIEHRAARLRDESNQLSRQIANLSYLSNLSLQMYGLYLRIGHARNEQDARMLREFFQAAMQHVDPSRLSLYEQLYYYQTCCWYYYALQDFIHYFRYAQKWVDIFNQHPALLEADMALYLKGMNNLLNAHFYNNYYERYVSDLQTLENVIEQYASQFDDNTLTSAFAYLYTARINKHFLEGTFTEGLRWVPEIMEGIERFHERLDQHRIMVFYYKIACLYFGSGDNENTIVYLNKIIHLKVGDLHADLQCFARILHLIAHYELENYTLVEYLVKSVYHFIAKNKDLSEVMQEIIRFLRKNVYTHPRELRQAFVELKDRLLQISTNPYEKRSFLYLDIISWLESKISGRTVQEIIQEKFVKRIPRY